MPDAHPLAEPPSLDPPDWEHARALLHAAADRCIEQLRDIRAHPWRPVDARLLDAIRLDAAARGHGLDDAVERMVGATLPFHSGNVHPGFFGWVQGTGNVAALVAELIAATMNSNCGGRDHGAVYVEREVIRWCAGCFGLPDTTGGVFVSGTSQATVLALAAARQQALGDESRRGGLSGSVPLALYAADGSHSAIGKALELVGIGSRMLRTVPVDAGTGGMDLAALAALVADDRAAGVRPFCVVGTAGSAGVGAFDPLDELATFCTREGLWFHVDGAYGAWARIADPPWRSLVNGIERADSIALDFHKWMFVQYDCGLLLMRDEARQRATFAARPSYLESQQAGLGGGEPWFCDYGTDLSRGFRALKVWATLHAYGVQHLAALVTGNCRLAAYMARRVSAAPELRLAAPVRSSVCCFGVAVDDDEDASRQNAAIAVTLQMQGGCVLSTTRWGGRTVLRAAITNQRTRAHDIDACIDAVRELAARRPIDFAEATPWRPAPTAKLP
jgi:aromatic-L-amino-acid/L-tryptophan decarboxylase